MRRYYSRRGNEERGAVDIDEMWEGVTRCNREWKMKGRDCGGCGKRFMKEDMKMHLERYEEKLRRKKKNISSKALRTIRSYSATLVTASRGQLAVTTRGTARYSVRRKLLEFNQMNTKELK